MALRELGYPMGKPSAHDITKKSEVRKAHLCKDTLKICTIIQKFQDLVH